MSTETRRFTVFVTPENERDLISRGLTVLVQAPRPTNGGGEAA